jgi:hypothetical protein
MWTKLIQSQKIHENKSCNDAVGESLGFQESDGEIVQESDTL